MRRLSRPGARQPRSIVLFYGSTVAMLIAVIAGVSLSVRAPAPPSIAEFAPQAVQQIKAPPRQQENGKGGDQSAAVASPSPTTSSTHPSSSSSGASSSSSGASSTPTGQVPIDKTRIKQCSATTQTANPQSAPCVNYVASDDNGGATAPGVTRDEIRVGIMANGGSSVDTMNYLIKYFNDRFLFYGRTITLVPFGGNLDPTSNDPAVENAAAAAAREQHLFAVLGPSYYAKDWSTFYDAMARAHVITIPYSNELGRTEAEFTGNRPYEWSFWPATDTEEQALANWACHSLAHAKAKFGGTDVKSKNRRFGIIRDQTAAGAVSDAALVQGLASCGMSAQVASIDSSTADDTTVQTALARMRQSGVTSIFLLGGLHLSQKVLPDATTLDYHPEWLTGTFGFRGGNDWQFAGIENYRGQWTPRSPEIDQVTHMFGLWPDNRPLDYTDAWWTQAILEKDHGFTSSYESQSVDRDGAIYNAVQLLANGIQLAGPRLTPGNFELGLFGRGGKDFPNPGAGAAPYYQSGYGFGAGDYNGSNDYAVVWWSNQAPPYNIVQGGQPLTGSWCMVGRGQRFHPGDWPSASSLFNPSAGCR